MTSYLLQLYDHIKADALCKVIGVCQRGIGGISGEFSGIFKIIFTYLLPHQPLRHITRTHFPKQSPISSLFT